MFLLGFGSPFTVPAAIKLITGVVDADPFGSGTFWPGRSRNNCTGSKSVSVSDLFDERICRIFVNFSSKWSNSSLITSLLIS
jgi:hypothetical protein